MLSLLSLLLASGTVLRADTERWTPKVYPNPRRNFTACNTWENSTLCDPDHILTDQWRAQINENMQKQMQRLTEANVPLADKAPAECANRTEGVTIYVLLAKRIWTPNNQTITGNDLTAFGDELAQQYGLNELPCKTFLLLIGIEAAKLAYVRTGKDLKLPADLMQRVFHEYKLFNAKNFMAGLNKIVDEIGEQMSDPFKNRAKTTASTRLNATSTATESSSTTLAEIVAGLMEKNEGNRTVQSGGREQRQEQRSVDGEAHSADGRHNNGRGATAPWWMFLSMGSAILIAFGSLAILAFTQQKRRREWLKSGARQLQLRPARNIDGPHLPPPLRMVDEKQPPNGRFDVNLVESLGTGDWSRRMVRTTGAQGEEEVATLGANTKEETVGQSGEEAGEAADGTELPVPAEEEESDLTSCSTLEMATGTCPRPQQQSARVHIGAAELETDVVVTAEGGKETAGQKRQK